MSFSERLLPVFSLDLNICSHACQAYLEDGFFNEFFRDNTPHRHQYAECYIITCGSADMRIAKKHYRLPCSTMAVVPPGKFHNVSNVADGSRRIAFQISAPITEFYAVEVPADLLALLETEIGIYNQTGEDRLIAPSLSLICSLIPCFSPQRIVPVEDRQFLLHEYLSKHYNQDITLRDVAELLNVSEKQAARLTRQYTGNTFRNEVCRQRMEVAAHLAATTGCTMSEIAEIVGFHSYSGFWKAWRKSHENGFSED